MASKRTRPASEETPTKTKPSLTVNVAGTHDLPKLGTKVILTVSGTVVETRAGNRYGDPVEKNRGSVTIEYADLDAVTIQARKSRSVKEIEEADERV